MIKGIIFDLDETLVNRTTTMEAFLLEQFQRFQYHLTISSENYVTENLKAQQNGYVEKQQAYTDFCKSNLQDLGLPKKLYNDYLKNYGFKPQAIDGAVDLLESLKEQYTLALITNGKTVCQNRKIDGLAIRSYFSTIKISEEEGIAKPDLEIFHRALNDIKLPAQNCLFIGDHPQNDIETSFSLGMKTIWVKNEKYDAPENCHAIIKNLADFHEALNDIKHKEAV
ncbi:MAG: HAD family hydrolase [Lentisphaeraceae bacterium]|nr:HAD family hydrolase [Lentisphaeraceae bacterium]